MNSPSYTGTSSEGKNRALNRAYMIPKFFLWPRVFDLIAGVYPMKKSGRSVRAFSLVQVISWMYKHFPPLFLKLSSSLTNPPHLRSSDGEIEALE